MKKQVLLVGGFHKAKSLSLSLLKNGYKVTAVNKNYTDCQALAEIQALQVIYGDGTKPYILEEAGASDLDIAIALTQKDEDNLVICELCSKKFGVPKTVSLVSDPKKTDFFYQMGIHSVVCAINAIAGIIEHQAFVDEMATHIPIGEGRVSIAELPITRSSPVAGKKLWEISLPSQAIIGCILRGEQTMIPRGDTRILAGDDLVVIASASQEMKAIRELTGR